jgi:N-methylhydantoinase B
VSTMAATTASRADTVELEIFRALIRSVLDEIELNLTKTAYSPLVYEYKDYTVGFLSPEFKLVSQSRFSLPMFMADLGAPVADAVEQIGRDQLQPGDVFLTNYAAVQGHHLNNVVMGAPIFAEAELVGYIAIRAHWSDVGGLAPGSISWDAREIYHEGVQFRGLRVMMGGRVLPEVVASILANTRLKEYVRGDLFAQLGCCLLAQRRWDERIATRWPTVEIEELRRRQYADSAAYARRAIGELPDGDFPATCLLDDAGVPGTDPLRLGLVVRIRGEEMVIDLSGMPPQVAGPINAGRNGGGVSMCRLAYKAIIAPDHPLDEGLLEPLEVHVPDGTMLSAGEGAPMGHWNNSLALVGDLVIKALADAVPERVPASHHGAMNLHAFSGRRASGEWWYAGGTLGGGWGGSVVGDGFGPLKTNHHGDNREVPTELFEAKFPLRVVSVGFRPDSGGAGMHRGGLGVEKIVRVEEDGVRLSSGMDRTLDPPWGVNGGGPGAVGTIDVFSDGEWRPAKKVTNLPLRKGDLVRVRTGGGGGWGSPSDRSSEAVARDLREGFVTAEAARAAGYPAPAHGADSNQSW